MGNLEAVPIEEASTEQVQKVIEMITDMKENKTGGGNHKCWTFVPSKKEYDMMAEFAEGSHCPKCGKGQIVLEIFKGDIAGDCLWLFCYWGEKDCGFRKCVSDLDKEW